jgi:hypothetical protein
MSSITIVSDAPNCGVTYNHHSDDTRGVIYDCNMFIVQATGVFDLGRPSHISLMFVGEARILPLSGAPETL